MHEVNYVILIPEKCKVIFDVLINAGFQCFAVGGCVRDSLMGRVPSDWDFTTDASPFEIENCFSEYKTLNIGKEYGTITVIFGDDSFEITTFRRDGAYSDSRHPDSVTFTNSIIDDLSRRDFTMNSIAYSPADGLIDPFNGVLDIKNRIIRCTGEASVRFNEDAIRMLRALRFASVLGFTLEESTRHAIFDCAELLSNVHPSRMRKEFSGFLTGDYIFDIVSDYRDVLSVIIPEIKPMFNVTQNNPHHIYNVWDHTIEALKNSKNTEVHRLCVLFHDIGKPYLKTTDSKGIDHFKKHQNKSAEIAEIVLRRFCYPSDVVSDVTLLIKYHDERFRNLRYDIKRILGILGERLFWVLMDIIYSDISGQSDYKKEEKFLHRELVVKTAQQIITANECYSLSQLAVNGNDLVACGIKGKEVGRVLRELLNLVISDKAKNELEELLLFVPSVLEKLNSLD